MKLLLVFGTRPEAIKMAPLVNETLRLLNDSAAYQSMAFAHNPYGNGTACQKIRQIFESFV